MEAMVDIYLILLNYVSVRLQCLQEKHIYGVSQISCYHLKYIILMLRQDYSKPTLNMGFGHDVYSRSIECGDGFGYEGRIYYVTPPFIGRVHTQNDPSHSHLNHQSLDCINDQVASKLSEIARDWPSRLISALNIHPIKLICRHLVKPILYRTIKIYNCIHVSILQDTIPVTGLYDQSQCRLNIYVGLIT